MGKLRAFRVCFGLQRMCTWNSELGKLCLFSTMVAFTSANETKCFISRQKNIPSRKFRVKRKPSYDPRIVIDILKCLLTNFTSQFCKVNNVIPL